MHPFQRAGFCYLDGVMSGETREDQKERTVQQPLSALEWNVMVVASAPLIAASYFQWVGLPMTEVLGFVTGGICVWLVVREHMWNWPIGMANNVFYFILFLQGRLYADMGLQVIYLAIAAYGWWNWLYGGRNSNELRVSRTTPFEWGTLALLVPLATYDLYRFLVLVDDSAPFLDSFTTVLSLAAQYLLSRKRLENWWFWIAADIIYIPLYLTRQLPLTSVLYAVFLGMCIVGLNAWRRSEKGAA